MEKRSITVKDGNKYFFTTSSCNVENPLGVIKATLVEYSLYNSDNSEIPICKLYKTNDGNWYDLLSDNSINALFSTSLKIAIDESENKTDS